jgi:hypothetical protein
MIPKLAEEMVLHAKLKGQGKATGAFDGLTTPEQRKEAFRHAIRELGPAHPFGNWNGMQRTYGMVFQQIYVEPL